MIDPSVLNIGVCAVIVTVTAALLIRHENLHNRKIKKAAERRRQLREAGIRDEANMIRREYEQEKNKTTVVHTQNIICKNTEVAEFLEKKINDER